MKKLNRMLAIMLVLTLALSLAVPVASASEPEHLIEQILKMKREEKSLISEDALVYPYAQSLIATAIKGSSVLLQFKLNRNIASTDQFAVVILRSSSENLDHIDESDVVEERTYKMSDFHNGSLGMTWTADSRYPVGNYILIGALLDKNGNPYYQYYYAVELYVVAHQIPATGMEVVEFAYGDFEEFSQELHLNEICYLAFVLTPFSNTSDRKTTVTVEHPQILSANMDAGYVVLTGRGFGRTSVTVTCGNVKKTIPVVVERMGLRFDVEGEKNDLCVGMKDTISVVSSNANNIPYVLDYESKNPSVVSVKDGVVTAVGAGTATIVVSCADNTDTITYTVHPHDLPEGTPVTQRTATKPAMSVGPCSCCGQDDAVNIIEKAIFTDTDDKAWYSDHVDYVYEHGIMNGSGATTFSPDRTMTRAELVTVLYRIAGSPEVEGKLPFTDVEEGSWYSNAVLWASQNRIVNGVGNNRFAPTDNITREQIATILYRYTQSLSAEMTEGAELTVFPDSDTVADFALEGLSWAVAEGLITGTASGGVTTLSPKASATRAQLATIISRYHQTLSASDE